MSLAALVPQPPRFQAGRLLVTDGVKALVDNGQLDPIPYLRRHLHGDWGDVHPEYARTNQNALQSRGRLLSTYQVTSELALWVVTEADRSATTVFLPDEYRQHTASART